MKNLKSMSALILLTFLFLNCKTESKVVPETNSVYDYSVIDIEGNEVNLIDYHDKILLIVNVASECGFTSQYEGLQALQEKYEDRGVVVLGFPCNQFGGQEPGTSAEIKQFCESKFSVTFPLFEKIDVNGENEHPLYTYLKSEQSGLITDDIKWNFTKFLINREGKPINRYASQTTPEKIEADIEKELTR